MSVTIPEIFACNVFNEEVMKTRLPKNVYKALKRTMQNNEPLADMETADVVANTIKEWAIEKGLSPIMYIANNDILQSVYYHHQRNKKVLDWYNREDVKKQLANDTLIKGFPLDDFVKMMTAKQEHAINTYIIGYLKQYQGEYQKRPINNYEENEWRYLVPDLGGTEWFWTKSDYMKWRFPNNNMNATKPAPSKALSKYTLTFENKDISYVLIKNDEFKTRVIEYIKSLKTIGGNKITDESQKDDLISKIITLEQVKKDF